MSENKIQDSNPKVQPETGQPGVPDLGNPVDHSDGEVQPFGREGKPYQNDTGDPTGPQGEIFDEESDGEKKD